MAEYNKNNTYYLEIGDEKQILMTSGFIFHCAAKLVIIITLL